MLGASLCTKCSQMQCGCCSSCSTLHFPCCPSRPRGEGTILHAQDDAIYNKMAEKDVRVSAQIELCLLHWACGIYVSFEAGARDVTFSSCDGADEPVAQNGMVFCRVERRRLLRQVHEAISRCIGAAVKARSEREKVSMSALWAGMLLPSTWCFSSLRVPSFGCR